MGRTALDLAFWALVVIVMGVWRKCVRVTLTKAASHRLFPPKTTIPQNLNTCLWFQRDHVHNCLILYLMSVSAPYKMSHVCNDQVPIASSRMYLLKDQAAMVTVKTVFQPGITGLSPSRSSCLTSTEHLFTVALKCHSVMLYRVVHYCNSFGSS